MNLEASDYNVEKLFVNGLHVFFTNKTRFIYDHFLHWLVVKYVVNELILLISYNYVPLIIICW